MEEISFDDILKILKMFEEAKLAGISLEMGDLRLQARRGFPEDPREGTKPLVSIRTPLLGNFWRSSTPGDPPLVEIGTIVGEEDVIGHIQVLNSFYPVTSGTRCRIAKICAENGQMVEYNQALFLGVPE